DLVEDSPAAAEQRRLTSMNPFLQMLEEKWQQAQEAFQDFEQLFCNKVYGAGMSSGNYRLYSLRHAQWICTILHITLVVEEFNVKHRTSFDSPVLPLGQS